MATARSPEIAERAIEIESADDKAGGEPRLRAEPAGGGDQRQPAREPGHRAEMQEQRHQPPRRRGHPLLRLEKRAHRPDHVALHEDAVDHRDDAADDPGRYESRVLPVHDHTPLYGADDGSRRGAGQYTCVWSGL